VKIVKWYPGRIVLSEAAEELTFDYLRILDDPLDWGPQHVDLATQHLMRCVYFGWNGMPDREVLGTCCQSLTDGDEVIFWGEPVLASCLNTLWALETLSVWKIDLRRAYLVLSPDRTDIRRLQPEAVWRSISERIPVVEVLEPLIIVRQHLGSDSDSVPADRSLLPEPLQEWIAVTDHLQDFLPDERGLDMMDEQLLLGLAGEIESGNDWPTGARVVSAVDLHSGGHSLSDTRLWMRLMELAGFSRIMMRWSHHFDTRLVEVQLASDGKLGKTRFCLSELGVKALAGAIDALPLCSFVRWVGGRQVSSARPLRRPVGYRVGD
jgi:hypothetical protein